MRNIANDGTYELSQPHAGGAPVGYLVAVGAVQHWVLGADYRPPSASQPLVELTFTRVNAQPYSEARVRELHHGMPGSRYVFAEVSAQAAPVADQAAPPSARSKAAVGLGVGKKQIDLGCYVVTQGSAIAGGVCVTGGTTSVEAWRLATSDASSPAGPRGASGGPPVKAFQLIGAAPTTLTFRWLDEGLAPSDEHKQLDLLLASASASTLFAVCRDRSAPAAARTDAAQ